MRIENLEKCVEETIQSLHTNEAFADFISFCGRGNVYQMSAENIFATYHQKPDATFITGFDRWKKMGRFPLQKTGIAVYPFDTSNFFANYSDFVFDISDTKGREIKPWSMTPEIMDSLMEMYRAAKPGDDDNIEYLRNMLFESITGYALNYDTDLWFGEDLERRWNIHSLITDCSLKILCDRCNVKYELQESTLARYHQCFIKEDGMVNEELLSKCVKAIQIPSDVEQREGRILRQGNMYDKVRILRYVTKGTFDAYNWSIIENKQKFISQVMTTDSVARSCTDVDEAVLNYAEMKAIASGNPLIKEKMEVDAEVTRLQLIKRSYTANKYKLERDLYTVLPEKEERYKQIIEKISEDILQRNQSPLFASSEPVNVFKGVRAEEDRDTVPFSFVFNGRVINERKKAGELIQSMFQKIPADGSRVDFAEYAGFKVGISKNLSMFGNHIEKSIIISGKYHYKIDVSDGGDSDIGYVMRIQNCVKKFDAVKEEYQHKLDEVEAALESTKNELEKPFSKETELSSLLARQAELNEVLLEESKDDKQEQSVDEEMAVQQNHHRKFVI